MTVMDGFEIEVAIASFAFSIWLTVWIVLLLYVVTTAIRSVIAFLRRTR